MAIGDTVRPELGRMDFSVFRDVGRAAFLANESFGNALGDAAAAYFQGKKKKERAKEIEDELRRQGADPESAKAISKNPFLQNEYQRKKDAETRLKIAAMQVSAGDARTSDALNFQKKMYFDEQQAKAKTERDAESSARLLFDTPKTPEFKELQATYRPEQIPGTTEFKAMEENDPMGARPSIIAKTITEQPDFRRFAKQDSIALTQVPESLKPRARFIQDKVQSGEVSAIQGLGAINKLVGEVAKPPTISERIALDKRREEVEEKEEIKASEQRQRKELLEETNNILNILKTGKDVTGQVEGLDFVRALKKSVGYGENDEKLRRKLERYANKFTLENVSKLKGPLSEKELAFIQQSSPKITDDPVVWEDFLTGLAERLNTEGQGKIPQVDPSAPAPQSLQDEIERKKQMLKARQMSQYFDNPNIPNLGNQNIGN